MAQPSKKIQGQYTIYAHVQDASYTLAGNDRAAEFGIIGSEKELVLKCLTNNNINGRVVFNVENKIHIKRARIIPEGAFGLQTAPGYPAAKFCLKCVHNDGEGNLIEYDSRNILIPNWSEWFILDLDLLPAKRKDGGTDEYVGMSIDPSTSQFRLDDYNIQNDYIGQGVTARLELEVDTAGVTDSSTGQTF